MICGHTYKNTKYKVYSFVLHILVCVWLSYDGVSHMQITCVVYHSVLNVLFPNLTVLYILCNVKMFLLKFKLFCILLTIPTSTCSIIFLQCFAMVSVCLSKAVLSARYFPIFQ